ncbi:MAG: pseudouridine-5'-phosphate glycosidase [Chloroflexota bacterium]|nr:pseudouridine-5'-phosphate glycosidase [Chloroflexota bacterium]
MVALESALITHGLPHPLNVQTALAMEAEVWSAGALPATIAVLDGAVRLGLTEEELQRLAATTNALKVSSRGLAYAIATGATAGTTVSGTMWVASRAGIRYFATGGIGGVHRHVERTGDVSTDVLELSRTPVAVVCAGAKSILDIPRTLEYLETAGVPVLGYRTTEFPAFYTPSSGCPTPFSASGPQEAARVFRVHRRLGLPGGVLIACPPPASDLDATKLTQVIERSVREADECGIKGSELTPFLLRRVADLSGGESLRANVALLRNNARIAGEIAVADAAPRA